MTNIVFMEKLSIIVPVYNVKAYVAECVQSLLSQDYNNFEVILVDDGSTDGSSELCDELGQSNEKIRVIHQKNEGLSGARNTGLRFADGDFISFIDSDDYVAPNMFSSLITALKKSNASVAICNLIIFNRGGMIPSCRYGDEVVDYSSKSQVKFFAAALDSSCNRVFRTEAIRKNNLVFENKNIVAQEDYWFQIRLLSHITRIVTLHNNLYFYRERGSSITKSHSDGDITERNIDFYSRTERYIKLNTERSIEQFMEYFIVNLLTSSINNASDANSKVLLEIVSQYEKNPRFKSAISNESINRIFPGKGLRNNYTKMTFGLLRHGFRRTYAFFEAIRLKRLRSNDRTSLYYD